MGFINDFCDYVKSSCWRKGELWLMQPLKEELAARQALEICAVLACCLLLSSAAHKHLRPTHTNIYIELGKRAPSAPLLVSQSQWWIASSCYLDHSGISNSTYSRDRAYWAVCTLAKDGRGTLSCWQLKGRVWIKIGQYSCLASKKRNCDVRMALAWEASKLSN